MLEVYEGREPSRKLIRKIRRESIEIKAVHDYLIWLEIMAEGKAILRLYVSPHQLGRLGKYLTDGTWRGGIICPRESEPEGCDICELDDQAKYRQVLKEIERHKAAIQERQAKPVPWGDNDWERKQLSNLELEALMLKDSIRFGLAFEFVLAKPDVTIEWLPEDRQTKAKEFLTATKLAYDMREPEPESKTDLTDWKRKLFEL